MSSLRRWRQVGQGQFHKWETEGEEFEGTWRGPHEGRFGPLGTLETSEGLITFPLHTALEDRLKRVRQGAHVLVRYTGKQGSLPGPHATDWTRDRFYTIEGHQLPSVTTILDVIAKPALGPWYAKQERRYFETATVCSASTSSSGRRGKARKSEFCPRGQNLKKRRRARSVITESGVRTVGALGAIDVDDSSRTLIQIFDAAASRARERKTT
jgi:hypothetical protein